MKLTALTLLLAALVVAAPAWAQSPEPSVVAFTSPMTTPFTVGGATFPDDCRASTFGSGGWNGGGYLRVPCYSQRIDFSSPQSLVELFVRAPQGAADLRVRLCGPQFCDGDEIASRTFTPAPTAWTPIILGSPTGTADVHHVLVSVPFESLQVPVDIDDVTFSPTSDQPDTTISRPSSASMAFGTNHPLGGSSRAASTAPGSPPAPARSR